MNLDWLKKIWDFINGLNSQLKTAIIVIMLLGAGFMGMKCYNQEVIKDYVEVIEDQERAAEEYTLELAPFINECVLEIQKNDEDCKNVLLLNYHNSKKSLQGFRYLYLNCITEKPKGLDSEPVKMYWNELEYIYYEDEISRIHDNGSLLVHDVDSIKKSFPKIYRKLMSCNAQAAALYPIEGVRTPIGMIIILYKEPNILHDSEYINNVSP
jgi:hypothetical protein